MNKEVDNKLGIPMVDAWN